MFGDADGDGPIRRPPGKGSQGGGGLIRVVFVVMFVNLIGEFTSKNTQFELFRLPPLGLLHWTGCEIAMAANEPI